MSNNSGTRSVYLGFYVVELRTFRMQGSVQVWLGREVWRRVKLSVARI